MSNLLANHYREVSFDWQLRVLVRALTYADDRWVPRLPQYFP